MPPLHPASVRIAIGNKKQGSMYVQCHHWRVRLVGVLLAAGAGRRYGKPKVLVDGWLDIAIGALRDGGCNDVVLVLGAAEVVAPPGVTAITAPRWQGFWAARSRRAVDSDAHISASGQAIRWSWRGGTGRRCWP